MLSDNEVPQIASDTADLEKRFVEAERQPAPLNAFAIGDLVNEQMMLCGEGVVKRIAKIVGYSDDVLETYAFVAKQVPLEELRTLLTHFWMYDYVSTVVDDQTRFALIREAAEKEWSQRTLENEIKVRGIELR